MTNTDTQAMITEAAQNPNVQKALFALVQKIATDTYTTIQYRDLQALALVLHEAIDAALVESDLPYCAHELVRRDDRWVCSICNWIAVGG